MQRLLKLCQEIGLKPDDQYTHEGECFLEWHLPVEGEKEGNGVIIRLMIENEKQNELMVSFPLSWKKEAIFKELNNGCID